MKNSYRYAGYASVAASPQTAAMLSIVPGLGQLYNGEKRKGILFLDVAATNVLLLGLIFFTEPCLKIVAGVADLIKVHPNHALIKSLELIHFGSPASIVFLGLVISFVAYAVRDAYEHAMVIYRRRIYPDQSIEMNEATSGSYLLHFAVMGCCAILALFLLVPTLPRQQVTEIEFIQSQKTTLKPEQSQFKSARDSTASGKNNPRKKVMSAHAAGTTANSEPAKAVFKQSLSSTQRSIASAPAAAVTRPLPRLNEFRPAAITPAPTPALPAAAASPAGPRTPTATSPTAIPVPVAVKSVSGLPAVSPVPQVMSTLPSSGSSARVPRSPAGRTAGMVASAIPSEIPVPLHGSGIGSAPQPKVSVQEGRGIAAGTSAPLPSRVASSRAGDASNLAVLPRSGATSGAQGDDREHLVNPPSNPSEGAAVSLPSQQVNFGPYMADLQRRIKQQWAPPHNTESRRILVNFKIHRGGQLSHLRIAESSGLAVADRAALAAVENAAPFASLPAGSTEDVDIQFTFDYNVFGGGHASYRRF